MNKPKPPVLTPNNPKPVHHVPSLLISVGLIVLLVAALLFLAYGGRL